MTRGKQVVGGALAAALVLWGSDVRPSPSLLPSYTVAALPANPGPGFQAYVTNGIAAGDCTQGLGTIKNVCVFNGTAWVGTAQALGGGEPLAGSGSFSLVRTSNTTLTIGPGCSVTNPCNAAFADSNICVLTAPATAVIGAGTNTAYFYYTPTCTLTVGADTMVVTCTGCTSVTGVAAFPAGTIKLWTWAASAGVWANGVGTDNRNVVQKGADPLARFWVSSAATQLVNANNIGALTTGLVKITVSAGVATPSTAVAGVDYAPAGGGGSSLKNPGATFTNGGSAIAAGAVTYVTAPAACTVQAYIVWADTGTFTADVWKVATGTALPTVANTIISGASYLGLSANTYLRSTTLTSLTTTSVASKDILGFKLQAVTGSPTQAHIELECL